MDVAKKWSKDYDELKCKDCGIMAINLVKGKCIKCRRKKK